MLVWSGDHLNEIPVITGGLLIALDGRSRSFEDGGVVPHHRAVEAAEGTRLGVRGTAPIWYVPETVRDLHLRHTLLTPPTVALNT